MDYGLTSKEWERVDSLVERLDLSIAEAIEMVKADKEIDHGEKLFELPDELKAGAKKARQADRKKSTEPVKRERKADEDKRFLIRLLENALTDSDDERFGELPQIQTTNIEREIEFKFNDRKFKIVLSAPRS